MRKGNSEPLARIQCGLVFVSIAEWWGFLSLLFRFGLGTCILSVLRHPPGDIKGPMQRFRLLMTGPDTGGTPLLFIEAVYTSF